MLDLKSLRKRFNTDQAYSSYISNLDDILRGAKIEYCFLGFSEEKWNFYLNKSVELNLESLNTRDISITLKRALKNYIKREVAEKRPRILNNLLKVTVNNNTSFFNILKKFVRSLELYEIKMDEEYFKILVESSPLLTKLLHALNVAGFSFTDLKNFLEGKELSNSFRCPGYNSKKNTTLFNYVMSCLKNEAEVRQNIAEEKKDDDYNKVSLFIRKYEAILKIHALFKEVIGDVDDNILDKAILSLSYKELNELLNNYYQYTSSYPKDFSFLFIISSRINKKFINFNAKKSVVLENPVVLPDRFKEGAEDSKVSAEPKEKTKLRSIKSLDDRFPLIDGITIAERKQIVEMLFSDLSIEKQNLVKDYLLGKIRINNENYLKVNRIIAARMQKYRRYGRQLLDSSFKQANNKNIRDLYSYFPVQKGMTEEERNQIVDILFGFKDEQTRKLINDYLLKKITDSNLIIKVCNYINKMKRLYQIFGKIILTPFYKPYCQMPIIYSLFGLTVDMAEEERNKAVDAYLEGKFYFDYVQKIFKDLKWKLKDDLEEERKKVLSDALKVIEYVYREKRNMTRPAYYEYFKKRVIEIYTNGNSSLADILKLYVDSEFKELNLAERPLN